MTNHMIKNTEVFEEWRLKIEQLFEVALLYTCNPLRNISQKKKTLDLTWLSSFKLWFAILNHAVAGRSTIFCCLLEQANKW